MPYFDENPLQRLALVREDADAELDLRGRSLDDALALISDLLDAAPGQAKRFAVRFDPARGDGTQTLFQPLGRHLLNARREGRLQRFLPLPDGAGFYLELPDSPEHDGSGG